MSYVDNVIEQVKAKNAEQPEFIQAVTEVLAVLGAGHRGPSGIRGGSPPRAHRRARARRSCSACRGSTTTARFRSTAASACSSTAPSAPTRAACACILPVNLGIIKFLGFEQIFKNSLTTPAHGRRQGRLRLRPEGQVRHGGHALLPELHDRAVPPHRRRHRRAGRRHRHGRPRDRLHVRPVQDASRTSSRACSPARAFPSAARSPAPRPPATAWCTSWRRYLKCNGDSFDGKTVVHLRLRQRGHLRHARRPSSSAPRWLPCPTPPAGSTIRRASMSRCVKQIKEVERGRITEYADRREGVEYHEGRGVWVVPCDIALPCATQNELHMEDAENAREERLQDRRRGRQHAHHPRGHRVRAGERRRVLPRARRPTPAAWPPPVWRCRQNSDAPLLDLRGSGREAARASW